MVTSVDVYKEIRRLQLEGVTSQRRAATLLGISRNTVKKYWEGNAVPWERQTYEREAAVLTPEVVRFIENCLEADAQERVRKQHHTARRIYNRLVEECGFTGSESSIRKAVRRRRSESAARSSDSRRDIPEARGGARTPAFSVRRRREVRRPGGV